MDIQGTDLGAVLWHATHHDLWKLALGYIAQLDLFHRDSLSSSPVQSPCSSSQREIHFHKGNRAYGRPAQMLLSRANRPIAKAHLHLS